MTLHINTSRSDPSHSNASATYPSVARERLVAVNRNNCPQCGGWLLAPEWSEYLSERCVRHVWACDACSYEFETSVYFAAQAA